MSLPAWLADNFRRGLNQAPRTTWRHWPIVPAALITVLALAGAFLFRAPAAAAPRHAAAARTLRVSAPRLDATSSVLLAKQHMAPPPPASLPPATYTVAAGGTLSSAAQHVFGHASDWPALWWANHTKIANPAAVPVGTVLTLPASGTVSPAIADAAVDAIPVPKPPAPKLAPAYQPQSPANAPNPPPSSYSGGVLSPAQVGAYWLGAGGPAWAEAAAEAVAMCESGDNPMAYNPSGATGLWQILGQVVPGNLNDPAVNAANAVSKFNASGQTWGQWVCQP